MGVLLLLTKLFSDKFYETHAGEVFVKSQCLFHEHAISNLLSSVLTNLGYRPIGDLGRQWERKIKKDFYTSCQTTAISFADSFKLCGNDRKPPNQWFNRSDVVITDNHPLFSPEYVFFQVPTSYFGIYSYAPDNQNFDPQRRFSFSVTG